MGLLDKVRGLFESDKVVTEIPVEVDAESMAEVGWEVLSCSATVSSQAGTFHNTKLAVRGELRPLERPDLFTPDKYTRPPVVIAVHATQQSDKPALFAPLSRSDRYATSRFDEWGRVARTAEPLDPAHIVVRMVAFDSFQGSQGFFGVPRKVQPIAIESVNASTVPHISLRIDSLEAFVWDDDGALTGVLRAFGSVDHGTPEQLLADPIDDPGPPLNFWEEIPFEAEVPQIRFDLLDAGGRFLDSEDGLIDIYLRVDETGVGPSRAPRWAIDTEFDPVIDSTPVARIRATIYDA